MGATPIVGSRAILGSVVHCKPCLEQQFWVAVEVRLDHADDLLASLSS